ncbi:MAG TPA: extracellular solute-binding protein [Chloroflexota bacterium]|nr:extracellular solute-binding protein [Chloroflexota bacterium]
MDALGFPATRSKTPGGAEGGAKPARAGTRTTSRRALLGATLAAGSAALAAACGYAPVDGIAPARSYRAPRPAKLSIQLEGIWDTQRVLREKLFPVFEQRHPGISVTLTAGAVDLPQLRRQAASGRMPDVLLFGASQVPAVAEGKLAVPLDGRIATWGHLGDFLPASLVSSQWGGRQWGLPLTVEVRMHLWRKGILENAGFDRAPGTWDEVAEAVRRSVLVERGSIVREGYPRPDGWLEFSAALATLGKSFFSAASNAPSAPPGHATAAPSQTAGAATPAAPRPAQVDIAGPEGMAALNYLLSVFKATRPAGVPPLRGRNQAAYPFATGALAHTVDTAAPLRALEQTYPAQMADVLIGDPPVPGVPGVPGAAAGAALETTPAPTSTPTAAGKAPNGQTAPASKIRPVTLLSSEWLGVGSQSPSQDQAWRLIQYLLEPASLAAVNETKSSRAPRKSLSAARYLRAPHLERMVALSDRFGQPVPRVPDQAYFRDTLRSMAEEVFAGRATVEAALAIAARQLQTETDKLGVSGFWSEADDVL